MGKNSGKASEKPAGGIRSHLGDQQAGILVAMLQRRHIIQDWIRVEDYEVGSSEYRTFEYHVVANANTERVTLTIKCLDADATTVKRLDPNELAPGTDNRSYQDIAARRVRKLFTNGMI